MRYLFTPEELTVPSLLTLDTLVEEARRYLQGTLRARLEQGQTEVALEELAALQEVSWERRARYTFAFYTLYRAELLRRLCRWEEALAELKRARPWLQGRVDTDARYDEAIALYLEGMLHYRLHAEQAAREALLHTQALLQRSEEDWHYRLEDRKLAIARRLSRWIEGLLSLQAATPPRARILIVPLYLSPAAFPVIEPVAVPAEGGDLKLVDRTYHCRLLMEGERTLCPFCDSFYFALRVGEEEAPYLPDGRPGDLVVMAWEAPRPLRADVAFALRSFRRYPDGRIVWEDESQPVLKLGGLPRMLCHVEQTTPSAMEGVQGGTG